LGDLPPVRVLMRSTGANRSAMWLAASALVTIGLATSAGAKTKRSDDRGRVSYGQSGPNVVYQQGPRTRCRKDSCMDYAFPPDIGYPTFARENNNRPIDRQPLSTPSDIGGSPRKFPLH
jgi:hypothetical protein